MNPLKLQPTRILLHPHLTQTNWNPHNIQPTQLTTHLIYHRLKFLLTRIPTHPNYNLLNANLSRFYPTLIPIQINYNPSTFQLYPNTIPQIPTHPLSITPHTSPTPPPHYDISQYVSCCIPAFMFVSLTVSLITCDQTWIINS